MTKKWWWGENTIVHWKSQACNLTAIAALSMYKSMFKYYTVYDKFHVKFGETALEAHSVWHLMTKH
jgi:hypothetical protein